MGNETLTQPSGPRPAFYALDSGGWHDWWTLLHPPYTLWNLSYVAIGSALAPHVDVWRLVQVLGAFFLGLGISAHALDELNGRPLRTQISDRMLIAAAVVGLLGAVALGLEGVREIGVSLLPFIVIGVFSVLAYNLEWFGGRFHTDAGFGLAWGAFPVLTGYFVQAGRIELDAVLVAAAALWMSLAQRVLSTQTRLLRRYVQRARLELELAGGEVREVQHKDLVVPFDAALKAMSWAMISLAAGLVLARLRG
ncbi:MAG: hypothetical protein M3P18_23550 [Actinomycetota bacterium]|nr:hypothetical protein [Actinomycetota bacterium]